MEHLIQAITALNGWSQWAAIKEANCRKVVVATTPIPLKVEKIIGVNELISTSLTCCSYIPCLVRDTITGSNRIKNSYIKKGSLMMTSPKSSWTHIKKCILLYIVCGISKRFPGIQNWLNGNVMTTFGLYSCSEIHKLIMT